MLLAVTGFASALKPLIAALALIRLFPHGTIAAVGPLVLSPEVRIITIVPLLMALAVAVSHNSSATPVVFENRRTLLARVLSLGTALGLSLCLVAAMSALGGQQIGLASLRNLLWTSGLALLVSALAGPVYAWFPLVLALGVALVSPADEADWSPYGLLLRDSVSPAQLLVAAGVFTVGAVVRVLNPRHHGYLIRARGARRP